MARERSDTGARLTRAEVALDDDERGSQGEPPGVAGWGVGRTGGRIPAGPHTGAVTGERRVAAGGGVSAQERPA